MRSQSMIVKGLIAITFAFSLWGCSTKNDKAPLFDPTTGKHPAGWVDPLTGGSHPQAFFADSVQCMACHGSITDLQGGISRVSCGSASFNGITCHGGGPGHPTGWRDPSLHGAAAKSQPGLATGFSSCQYCHGADFAGGISKVSCFSASTGTGSCHGVNAPHSPKPWRTYPAPIHTNTVDDGAGLNAAACALCHTAGNNLATTIIPTPTYVSGKPGCFNSTLCHGQIGHPKGWAQPKNHGAAAMSNLTYCQQCHSDNPLGGPGSNPRFNVVPFSVPPSRLVNGCEDCHAPLAAHPRVLQIPAVFGTITTLNRIGTRWYLHCKVAPSGFDACNRCHGAALDGVGAVAGATACTFCHRIALPTNVKNCQSCHSNPPNGTAYPNIAAAHLPSAQAVQSHSTLNLTDICGECHYGLGSVTLDHFSSAKNWGRGTNSFQPGHVVFGAFTFTNITGHGPSFNATNQQCTNTYCHGKTLVGGANKAPIWNSTTYLTAAGCGTCHGFPPVNAAHTGFTSATPCNGCHAHVNATNNGFTDPTKHVNGAIDVSGGAAHAFPYPGSQHLTAAVSPFTACLACHTNNKTVNFPYPPAVGTPPDCQGCHVKAPPGNSCGSCHGTAANGGRANGSSFPDVAGQHSNNHGGFSCATCHGTAGTGQATHGNSNFILHNDANVVVSLPSTGNTITYLRSGLADGHGSCSGTCNGQGHTNAGNRW